MSQAEEFGEMFMVWKAMEKVFLRTLIARLMLDVPSFNHDMFVTRLQLLQEEMPVHDDNPDVARQALMGLGYIEELMEMTEAAVQDARSGL